MVGEHLNEATITRLGSILECGNMPGQANCRHTPDPEIRLAEMRLAERTTEAMQCNVLGESDAQA